MNAIETRTCTALVLSALLACASHATSRDGPREAAPVVPSFTFRNLSRERIAVYLLEDSQELLLRRLAPLESARLPLPDRFFTERGATIRLAIIVNGSTSLQPSREKGAILSLRHAGASLAGQTWSFAQGQLLEP